MFDFKSLYPSLIRTFNIDPLTHVVPAREAPDAAARPHAERRRVPRATSPASCPALVARLWDERAQARRRATRSAPQAIKILMNSLFGVLGSPASRLFSPAVANAITLAGQHVIRLAAAAVERRGHRVIYGDTDSLFVDAGEPDAAARARRAETPARRRSAPHVAAALRARVRLSEPPRARVREGLRALLPARGARRRDGQQEALRGAGRRPARTLEFVGLEAVRRDWSAVARRFQRELLDARASTTSRSTDFVRDFVADLRAGRLDDELVYRKAVRKPLDAYTQTTPPHVKAARKQAGGRRPHRRATS